MTLTLALEEFQSLSIAAGELAARVRTARFILSPQWTTHVSVGPPIERLETLAHQLRELGHHYSGGEDLFTRVIGRLALGLTPLAVVFSWAGSVSGLLPTGHIRVHAESTSTCTPPQGFASLLGRIPDSHAQVRIDRLGDGDNIHFVVYIAGTQDFGAHVSTDPWDMTSNLQALSNTALADSELAVRRAMAHAGIDAQTPVTLVGHSQGGLIAARLAAAGDYTVTDLVVAGSPSHTVSVPQSVRVTAFEHSNDVIPVLSGPALATVSAGTLFIRQAAPSSGRATNLPSHDLQGYVSTARTADASTNPVVRARKQALSHATTQLQQSACSAQDFGAERKK